MVLLLLLLLFIICYERGGIYINRNVTRQKKSTPKVLFLLSVHNWIFFCLLVTGVCVAAEPTHKKKFPGRSSTSHLDRFFPNTKTAKPSDSQQQQQQQTARTSCLLLCLNRKKKLRGVAENRPKISHTIAK
jgi:hypothetical protein